MHEKKRHIATDFCRCCWVHATVSTGSGFEIKKKRVTSRLYRLFRDLKIRGRDKLRRLPEVNLHNETCAQKPQIRALAVLVSWRTPFSLFCRHLKNVRILGLFLSTIRHNRFPFQIWWPWCFIRPYSSRFLSEIFRNEEKKAIIWDHCLLCFAVATMNVPECPVKKSKSVQVKLKEIQLQWSNNK